MTSLHIPKPCHENWEAMTPQERGRHCQVCDKSVVDVTRMRPAEGRRFLGRLRDDLAAGAQVCVRVHADAAGRLLAPSATRRLLTNGLAAVLAVAVAGCSGTGPQVSQAQPAQTQQVQPTHQPQPRQPMQMMGEPVATGGACIQGDVAVAPPRPQPPQQVELGRVRAVDPVPQPVTGAPAQPPTIMGGIAVDPAPRETMGKVRAVDR